MTKSILFASVLAVTIPVGFFSPTPLDRITMNLNIDDSSRGHDGSSDYAIGPPEYGPIGHGSPEWGNEEDVDVPTIPTNTTDPREQEDGEISIAGGHECGALQIAECGITLPGIVLKCWGLFQATGPFAIFTCANDLLGDGSKCKPCICYFFEKAIVPIPCPNLELGQDGSSDYAIGPPEYGPEWGNEEDVDVPTIPTNTTDPREQEDGEISIAGGHECGVPQIAECVDSLPAIVLKCVDQFKEMGPLAIFTCVKDILGDGSKCKPCICYFLDLATIPCPNLELDRKAFLAVAAGVQEDK